MRLSVRISPVEPGVYELPERCPHSNCDDKHFEKHHHCAKAIRDPRYEAVEAQRYRCLRCGHTFRVYPKGVSRAQQSDALRLSAYCCMSWVSAMEPSPMSWTLCRPS